MKDLWVQLPEEVREGDELAGKYRIGPIIGVGASSIVVAARDLPDGRQVAIKFLRGGVDANSRERGDEIVRFVREAHAAMSIPNERVVRVFEVALLDSGMPYIVMEHLEGADLANTLLEQGPLSIENAVDYLLEACEAIADAHRLGIVHRDLKPANLFLVHRPGWPPTVKVLDFGISKRTIAPLKANGAQRGKRSVDITDASTILGTPFYMSPEQMESTRDVDARADIWSLGVTLFELLTTNRPYCGNTIVQMYSKIVKGPPLWKQELHGYPAGFLTVLAKCLAPDRNRRYASVGDLARALAPFGTARAANSLLRIRQTLTGSGLIQSSTLEPHTLGSVGLPSPLEETARLSRVDQGGKRTKQRAAAASLALSASLIFGVFAAHMKQAMVPAGNAIAAFAARKAPTASDAPGDLLEYSARAPTDFRLADGSLASPMPTREMPAPHRKSKHPPAPIRGR